MPAYAVPDSFPAVPDGFHAYLHADVRVQSSDVGVVGVSRAPGWQNPPGHRQYPSSPAPATVPAARAAPGHPAPPDGPRRATKRAAVHHRTVAAQKGCGGDQPGLVFCCRTGRRPPWRVDRVRKRVHARHHCDSATAGILTAPRRSYAARVCGSRAYCRADV